MKQKIKCEICKIREATTQTEIPMTVTEGPDKGMKIESKVRCCKSCKTTKN